MSVYRLLIDYGFSAAKAREISVDYVRCKQRAIEVVKAVRNSCEKQTNSHDAR